MSKNLHAFTCQGLADACGRTFEFGNPQTRQVQRYIETCPALHITDDTQMALFGLHGITQSLTMGSPIHTIKRAYLDWLRTQEGQFESGLPGLLAERKLWKRQAPGITCLNSLASIQLNRPIESKSNGCGTVMRLLPFALYGAQSGLWQYAEAIAIGTSIMTHKGDQIVPTTKLYMQLAKELIETGDSYKANLYSKMVPTITSYGTGWHAAECLNMALWAFGRSKTFKDLLMHSICHEGDSDSVAAVAGSLWGLAGRPIPDGMENRLVEHDVIQRTVMDFEVAIAHVQAQRL